MNWRPENWKNPHIVIPVSARQAGKYERFYHNLFEEGADAMLQAVCEKIGKELLTDEETFDTVKKYPLQVYRDFDEFCGALPFLATVAQAQLNKILAMLQGKETP